MVVNHGRSEEGTRAVGLTDVLGDAPRSGVFVEAAEGIRTLDLLHGN
jgi:hypothetical protein